MNSTWYAVSTQSKLLLYLQILVFLLSSSSFKGWTEECLVHFGGLTGCRPRGGL